MKQLIWISGLSYLLIGLAHVVIGSIMPVLLEHYKQDYSAGGSLIFAQFAGFLVGVLGTPWLIGRVGKRRGIILAMTILGAAEILYSLLPAWKLMYVIGACAGFAFGMIEAVIGTLIIAVAAEQAAVAMSRIEVAFGIGALVMPLISGWLIASGRWSYGFFVIGLFALGMLVIWMTTRFGELGSTINEKSAVSDYEQIANEEAVSRKSGWAAQYQGTRGLLLAVFVLFFFIYVGTEMGMVNFLPSMLIEKTGIAEAPAAYSVAAFWLAMSVGRVYAGLLAQKIGFARYILSGVAISLVFMGLFNSVKTEAWMFAFIFVVGLFMSGLFSIALVYATQLLPGSEEMTPSLLIAAGGTGGAALPLLLGLSMDHYGADVSGWLLAGALGVLLLLGLVVVRISRQGRTGGGAAAQSEY